MKQKYNVKLFYVGIISFLYLLILSVNIAAAQENAIRVCFFEFEGYYQKDSNGNYSGYGYEYIQEIGKHIDRPFTFIEASWSECQKKLSSGQVDLLTSAKITKERLELFEFIPTPMGTSYARITTGVNNQKYLRDDYESLNGTTIGLLHNNSINENLERFAASKNFKYVSKYYNTQKELLQALHSGEVETILTSSLYKLQNEKILVQFDPKQFYAMVQKDNIQLAREINNALISIEISKPQFKSFLYNKYYGTSSNYVIALSKDERDYLKEKQKIKVAVFENFKPLFYYNAEGEAQGIVTEVMHFIADKFGITVEFVPFETYQDQLDALHNKEVDLIAANIINHSYASENELKLTTPYLDLTYSFITSINKKDNFATIGTVKRLSEQIRYVQERYKNAKIVLYDTEEEVVDAVLNKTIDAGVMNTFIVERFVQNDFMDLRALYLPSSQIELAVAFPIQDSAILYSLFDRAILTIDESLISSVLAEYTLFQDYEVDFERFAYQNFGLVFTMIALFITAILSLLGYIAFAKMKKAKTLEKRSQAMVDSFPLPANFWNKKLELIHCNQAMSELIGVDDREELLSRFIEFSPQYQPDGKLSKELILEYVTKTFNEGYCQFEWIHQSLSKVTIPVKVTLIRLNLSDGDIVMGYVQDLRELKGSQDKIKETEEMLQKILDVVSFGIILLDQQIVPLYVNSEALRLSGVKSQDEFIEHIDKIIPTYHSHEFRTIKMSKVFEEGYMRYEYNIQHINGEIIPVEVTLLRIMINKEPMLVSCLRDLREFKSMLAEIESTQEKLRIARDTAEQNSQYKSEFLANMSHELRTPLNGISGLLYLLSDTKLEPLQQDYLQKTLYSTESLLRIINDILDFSKIEAGKIELEKTSFTLNSIVVKLNEIFEHKVKEKGLEQYTQQDEFAKTPLMGDPLRVEQILINLMGNAIKFTEKGSVTLTTKCKNLDNGQVSCEFSVQDTGIGLNKEQQERLFLAFTQVDGSITRQYGGTGLGLAISKQLVELMGGQIWIESEVGKGAKFFFTVIFDKGDDCHIEQKENQIMIHTQKEGHILLAEDNEINQLVAEELLKKRGYVVDTANNGQEALDMLEQRNYDLILMDLQMPVMDGFLATKKIRGDERFKHLPIIALSANAMSEDRAKSLEHGMNDHIAKPISPQILFATLDRWIDGAKKEK